MRQTEREEKEEEVEREGGCETTKSMYKTRRDGRGARGGEREREREGGRERERGGGGREGEREGGGGREGEREREREIERE